MKRYLYALAALTAALCMCITSCGLGEETSLKDIAKPYIARYECTQATLGGDDLLKDFDYIRITILDEKEAELSYRQKGQKAMAVKFGCTYDSGSGALIADGTALGVRFKEKTVIEDGAFTISFPLGGRELILRFEE